MFVHRFVFSDAKIRYRLQGGGITCEGRDDAAEFADIRSAMKVLLFSDVEIWEVLKLLAALLHMGNIKYRATVVGKKNRRDCEELFREEDSPIVLSSKPVFPKLVDREKFLNVIFLLYKS